MNCLLKSLIVRGEFRIISSPFLMKSGLCLSPSKRSRIVVDFSDMDGKLELIILCADADCGTMGLPVLMHVGAPGAPI